MAGTDSSSKPSLLYRVIARGSSPLVFGLFRLEPTAASLPPGLVLAANHLSNFDPWPLGLAVYPRPLRFMAKAELYKPVLGAILEACGAFPVRRGERDPEAYRTAVRLAQEGEIVAMFPEGDTTCEGRKEEVGCPAPSGSGTDRARGRRAACTCRCHRRRPPRPPRPATSPARTSDRHCGLVGIPRREAAERATERLMKRIAELEAGS